MKAHLKRDNSKSLEKIKIKKLKNLKKFKNCLKLLDSHTDNLTELSQIMSDKF